MSNLEGLVTAQPKAVGSEVHYFLTCVFNQCGEALYLLFVECADCFVHLIA